MLECDFQVKSSSDLLALKMCLKSHSIAPNVIKTVVKYYIASGIDEPDEVCDVIPLASLGLAVSIVEAIELDDPWIEFIPLANGIQSQR